MTMTQTNIHHHVSDATLMAYSAGSLPEHMSLVIASHLAMCGDCQTRLDDMDVLGGATLSTSTTMPMKAGALDQLMSMLDHAEVANDVSAPVKPVGSSEIPEPLRNFLPQDLSEIEWKGLAPGIKQFPIEGVHAGEGTVRLLKIAPGITIPEHGHGGMELTLVLKGSFSDEIGRFKAGDLADLDGDSEHQPIADTAEDCICLIATEGPLKFKSLLPKVMQYFVGM